MATTQLFVELLIIGIGAGLWLAFLLAAILRIPFENPFPDYSAIYMTAHLSVAYVVGIIVDRIARSAFKFIENRHCAQVFGDDKTHVEDRETYILVTSPPLREQIIYNRSRFRICRAWILNFALTFVFSGILAIQQASLSIAAIALSGLVFGFLTAYVASSLARDYYTNIRQSYDFLTKNKNLESKKCG